MRIGLQWLLTLWVLMRAVHIVASHDNTWELVRPRVCFNIHLCGGFAGCVWICWFQYTFLSVGFVVAVFAVDFIGTTVDELLDVAFHSCFKKLVCSDHVSLRESKGVAERKINV